MQTRAWLVVLGLLAVFLTGCNWEYFYEGDSYTSIAADDLTVLGGCPVAANRTRGARSLVTMIDELPELEAAMRDASSPPLVFFTAGAVDLVFYDTRLVTALLDYWVAQVLSVREDAEVIQFNYFGMPDYIQASRYREEPRWSVVHLAEHEESGYVFPGLDTVHLSGRSLTRRVALFFRAWPGYACAASLTGTAFPAAGGFSR